jgi:neutral trehalase
VTAWNWTLASASIAPTRAGNLYLTWDELIERLRKIRRTAETMAQYDNLDNIRRHKIKDGPAFVGGLVRGGRRK